MRQEPGHDDRQRQRPGRSAQEIESGRSAPRIAGTKANNSNTHALMLTPIRTVRRSRAAYNFWIKPGETMNDGIRITMNDPMPLAPRDADPWSAGWSACHPPAAAIPNGMAMANPVSLTVS